MRIDIKPRATLDADGENIESDGTHRGVDGSKAITSDTLVESMADVGISDMVQYRLTQQAILADFGLEALRSRSLADLEHSATRMSAQGMRARLCKILKYNKAENVLFVCAGVGWNAGVIGVARLGADMDSPAGYAFQTGKPVLSNHLENEERFRTPKILVEHGVRRAVNVLVMANDKPWGVLEVDSSDDGQFDVADIPFLQGFANLLGVAIERNCAEEGLRDALDYQRLLVRESSHRAKNSLALVSSLLSMQANGSDSGEVKSALTEAVSRIMTIAGAHDLLWQSEAAGEIDLGELIRKLCVQLQHQMPAILLQSETDSFSVDADRAIAAGLLVTELVTNAAKHAYADGEGPVRVSCQRQGDSFTIRVADKGKGFPADFSLEHGHGDSLGMLMITSLSQRLGGKMRFATQDGAVFSITTDFSTHA